MTLHFLALAFLKDFNINTSSYAVIASFSPDEEENTFEEAFQLGIDNFIAKPFNPNELLLRIKRFL